MRTQPPVLTEADIGRARAFADLAHAGQRRRYSGEPYIRHLDAVVGILRAFGIASPAILAAAYLHDSVEDTKTSIADILESFGEEVAELVYWLTDAEQGKRSLRKTMSAWRLGRAPLDAKLIKLADFIDNTGDICCKDWHFAPVYLREKNEILDRMVLTEGERLTMLPIFQEAKRITSLADFDQPASTVSPGERQ
jgi:GTP diphosphokinase / guanosine-3',5'-bis(diphosphate) 3'-diphosphatase